MKKKTQYNAKSVYYAYRIYQHFLLDNNLPDDSETITVDELMKYVKENISEEDFWTLREFCLRKY